MRRLCLFASFVLFTAVGRAQCNGCPATCNDGSQPVCMSGSWECPTLCGSCWYYPNAPCGYLGTAYCCTDSGGTHVCCSNGSPIVIDTASEGFHLTDLTNGVKFRELSGLEPVQFSWTDSRFHNAFLALDRNGNGRIDDLTELFGNLTPQPLSASPNGYLALAVFDLPENGGNGNGVIDPGDAVYSSLRLWVDRNHDGISQPEELFTLQEGGVFAIDLKYVETTRQDKFGNQCRYRSRIWNKMHGASEDRCYDVFLVMEAK